MSLAPGANTLDSTKIEEEVINQMILYWPSYRSEVNCIGPGPERFHIGSVTGPRSAVLVQGPK